MGAHMDARRQCICVWVCVRFEWQCIDYKMAPTTCRRRVVIVIVGIRWISYVSFAFWISFNKVVCAEEEALGRTSKHF